MKNGTTIRATAVQSAPVLFDKQGTLDKVIKWMEQAHKEQADLILFPEAFIPAYPRELTFGCKVGSRSEEGREVWQLYHDNAIEVPGPEVSLLTDSARKFNIYVSIGVVEKEMGTLYCTQLMIGPNGQLLGKHRKIKPTGSERIVWGEGDGTTLHVYDTAVGKIGGLICWENYMPLARVALYNKGVQIYLAPTADHRQSWQITLQHIAIEGGCYVLGCNQFLTMDLYPEKIRALEKLEKSDQIICRGGSVIIDPFGEIVTGPLWDEEGLLIAEIDHQQIIRRKMDLDVAGHYSRPDIFKFQVEGQPDIIHEKK